MDADADRIERGICVSTVGTVKPDSTGSSMDDPDVEFVQRAAKGDEDAVRVLVDRHMSMIHALSFRLLGNGQDAEDVTQEAFMRVWTHAKFWEPDRARFSTWLYRVSVNLCYDRLRKRREVLTDELPEQVDRAVLQDMVLVESEKSNRVREAVSLLPARQKIAITLCHFQGVSNIEAAEVMEVSIEALESLLARGRRTLRKILCEEKEELLGVEDIGGG